MASPGTRRSPSHSRTRTLHLRGGRTRRLKFGLVQVRTGDQGTWTSLPGSRGRYMVRTTPSGRRTYATRASYLKAFPEQRHAPSWQQSLAKRYGRMHGISGQEAAREPGFLDRIARRLEQNKVFAAVAPNEPAGAFAQRMLVEEFDAEERQRDLLKNFGDDYDVDWNEWGGFDGVWFTLQGMGENWHTQFADVFGEDALGEWLRKYGDVNPAYYRKG